MQITLRNPWTAGPPRGTSATYASLAGGYAKPNPAAHQRGFSGLWVLVLLSIAGGGSALLLASFGPPTMAWQRDQITTDALARAREGLIGYAVSRGDMTGIARPGELPCPDTKLATDPEYGKEDDTCGAGAIGRVPWRTLGIPEPKDHAGETLWYAVAGPFRRNPPNTGIINSDTRGNMVVYGPDGAAPLTTEAVAVIFAPAASVGSQRRSAATSAFCATTGTTIMEHSCAANYLEAMAGRNNAATNGPFVLGALAAGNAASYNDRGVYITAAEVLPAVEMRVAQEIKNLLEAYRANSKCKCYPWAADFTKDLAAAALPNARSKSVIGLNRGRFPTKAKPKNWGTGDSVSGMGNIPALPLWFTYNNWQNVIYYSVARQNTNGGGARCRTCSIDPLLSVDGTGASVVILTPGTSMPGATRPSNSLAEYFEDSQNRDGNNDSYTMPTAGGRNRDRMLTATAIAASLPGNHDDGDDDGDDD